MELLVVRHGPAAERDPLRYPNDADRPLTRDGRSVTRTVARRLARMCDPVRLIATSSAARARSTAEILQKEFEPAPRLDKWEELAPDSSADPVLERLANLGARSPSVVVVGHEPTLGELVGLALSGEALSVIRLTRAGAAHVTFDGSVAPGAGRLDWLLTRGQLSGN